MPPSDAPLRRQALLRSYRPLARRVTGALERADYSRVVDDFPVLYNLCQRALLFPGVPVLVRFRKADVGQGDEATHTRTQNAQRPG